MDRQSFPQTVTLVEVGPRDGLQHEATVLDTATRIEFIDRLSRTGLRRIEAGSFVCPEAVPEFAGTGAALVRHIVQNPMLNGTVIRLDGGLRM